MRLLSLTVPAALLLLLSAACNHTSNQKADILSGQVQEVEMKAPADRETSGTPADSAVAGAMGNEEGQAPINTSAAQSPTGKRPMSPVSPSGTSAAQANPDWDKKIVKTADLQVEVKNYQSFYDRLHRAVRQSGGYVAQEQQSQSSYKIENTVSIKIPVEQFDEVLLQLASDSDRLVEKKINADDVTLQIVDIKSRLETKREVRERYLDLLKQARNMNEILKVQNEINDIQEQMEGAAGRIAYLSHSAAFSTLRLNFYQVLDAGAKNEQAPSFLHKIKDALALGWDGISTVLIGLITLWPLWIGVGLVWMGVRKWRSTSGKRPAASLSGAVFSPTKD
ncbi:MAG TPA: DUF4349 domain-containing protein [Puia sp.]|nr:DUF4349 domain-containing protein [Puia sp.]